MSFLTRMRGVRQPIEPEAPPPVELPLVKPAASPAPIESVVFICGLHRSGTTLLDRLLRSHYVVAALDAPVPESEGQHLQDVYPAAREHGGPGRFAFSPAMRPSLVDDDPATLRHRLLCCWTPWLTGTEPVLLEKSPPNLTRIGWLRTVFPGARFIIQTRDPRAVAAATTKWSKTSYEELLFHWHVAHEAALEDEGPDCVRLRYEDLCNDPMAEVARIASFAGLAPRPTPVTSEGRFAMIRNSNGDYLASVPASRCGSGSWEAFGYEF